MPSVIPVGQTSALVWAVCTDCPTTDPPPCTPMHLELWASCLNPNSNPRHGLNLRPRLPSPEVWEITLFPAVNERQVLLQKRAIGRHLFMSFANLQTVLRRSSCPSPLCDRWIINTTLDLWSTPYRWSP